MTQEENKKTILIVEDEEVQMKALADELKDEGFRVITATNGQEGLDKATEERPDLILLDIIMPVMDGITMMKKLREENLWGEKVPVVLLTNLRGDSDEILKAVTRDEPAYYLVKSDWSLEDIMEKITERLEMDI